MINGKADRSRSPVIDTKLAPTHPLSAHSFARASSHIQYPVSSDQCKSCWYAPHINHDEANRQKKIIAQIHSLSTSSLPSQSFRMSSTQLFFQMHLPTYRRRCPLQEHVPPNESPVREAQESGPPRWRIFSRHHPFFPAKFCIAGQPRYRFCHDYSHSPFLHNLALFSLLLLQIGPCSTLLESSFSLENSPSNQSNAQFSADVSFFPISHHHHHSHFHLSKLLFPLVSSSFAVPLESFKSSTSQAEYSASVQTGTLNDTASTVPLRVVKRGEPGSKIGRKRKRELFALTISESEPLKTLRPSTFWTNTPPGSNARRRRLSSHSNALTSSGNILYGKSKSPYSALSPLSALTSSSAMAASANAANAAAGNMRMKILLNPPGFGGSLLPDQKCNFEIYPSGCFDENGSICDNPRSGLCVCRPGYSLRIASVYCLRPASIGEACYTTEQCERKVANSGCFNYREEYREENPSAFFGPSQTSWPMGECRCRIGHRFDELSKACVRSLIGSWCSNVWDCQMVEDDERNSEVESRPHSNHSRHSLPIQMLPWHSSSHVHGTKAKMANIVCESNICNCSQFFHYNTTAEECQFVETFGKSCRPNLETRSNPKRNLRSRASSSAGSSTYSISPRHHSSYRLRQLRSLPEPEADVLVSCNLPSTCSSNGTCVCAEGFEHQPTSTPQCQPTGHYTHLTGGSGRSGAKGDHNLGYSYYEGHSNVGNFIEYVLYILVPTLVLIFLVKPCFRRIGKFNFK